MVHVKVGPDGRVTAHERNRLNMVFDRLARERKKARNLPRTPTVVLGKEDGMACCTTRFDDEEERKSILHPAAIRTWRMRTGGTLFDFFRAHDICIRCLGRGWHFTLYPDRATCTLCSGSGYWREEAR
jgi:hypothetical protein